MLHPQAPTCLMPWSKRFFSHEHIFVRNLVMSKHVHERAIFETGDKTEVTLGCLREGDDGEVSCMTCTNWAQAWAHVHL